MGASISSYARDDVYELKDTVGIERAVYFHTDPVIYTQRCDDPWLLPTSNYLGQYTNQIKDWWKIYIFLDTWAKIIVMILKITLQGNLIHLYNSNNDIELSD